MILINENILTFLLYSQDFLGPYVVQYPTKGCHSFHKRSFEPAVKPFNRTSRGRDHGFEYTRPGSLFVRSPYYKLICALHLDT